MKPYEAVYVCTIHQQYFLEAPDLGTFVLDTHDPDIHRVSAFSLDLGYSQTLFYLIGWTQNSLGSDWLFVFRLFDIYRLSKDRDESQIQGFPCRR